MKNIDLCRCCGEKKLLLYLDLGSQPLANSYHKRGNLPTYPLEVTLCRQCFHSQLSLVINPTLMFKNYLYVSGTTDTFQKHCESLAKDAIKRVKGKKIHVLDIACNDGTLLEYFREFGCDIWGVDPAENLREITRKKNIPVVVDYWNKVVAKKFKQKFTLITGTNVFAHIDHADDFLEACFFALEDNGLLILEFPYCDKMVKYNEFDTIYHEHVSYFLVNSFATLTKRLNFHIVDLLQTPIHGGSIRFFLKKGEGQHTQKVFTMIANEKKNGLFTLQTYRQFAKEVAKNRTQLQTLVTKLTKENKKIIGYGASAKGNTMLNYFKIDIDYIVDDNPLKWGFLTPGRNIPITSPDTLQQEQEDLYIIILSWNFHKEIVKKIKNLRGKRFRDYSILYVPTVTLHSLNTRKTTL